MSKVLIVDSEEGIRMLYAEELQDEGYDIFTTCSYSKLMDIANEYKPDLIVFDIRLGKVSDLDLLQNVKKAYKNISVILCSGYLNYPSNIRSWIADFYIGKSSDLRKLKRKIKTALTSPIQQL
jgi:DNA-binding NtrC family response regulator